MRSPDPARRRRRPVAGSLVAAVTTHKVLEPSSDGKGTCQQSTGDQRLLGGDAAAVRMLLQLTSQRSTTRP